MNLPAWRAALRIARREAWRAKGRSLLIVLMIALPVFGASAADITYRSQQLDRDERLERVIGQADAKVSASASGPVAQDPDNAGEVVPARVAQSAAPPTPPAQEESEPLKPDVLRSVPAGSAVLSIVQGPLRLRTVSGIADALFIEFDYAHPIAEGILRQTAGRTPKTGDEVVVTEKFLSAGGLRIGGTITEPTSGRVLTIVGTVVQPNDHDAEFVYANPGALLAKLNPTATPVNTSSYQFEYLVDAPDGSYTWDKVRKLNEQGIVATSREVDGSKLSDSEVPYRTMGVEPEKVSDLAMAVGAVVVGMALLEIVLLAGPAFAVGARRRKRELGLIGVAGGDQRHIRTIVLADGVVLGAVAGVLGTALGMGAAWFSRDWFAGMSGKDLGHYEARPLELAAVIFLGLMIGVTAALVPAVLAARESIIDSLTGRRGVRRGSRVLPLVGIAVGVAGLGMAYYGAAVKPTDAILLGGCVLAQLGLIACCPALLGLAGRLGRYMPLTPRLALRDAARNRPRTAPAVAAVMAAVAGAVAVTAYWAGVDHDNRESHYAIARHGQVVVYPGDLGHVNDALTKAVEGSAPVKGKGAVPGYWSGSCRPGQACTMVHPKVPEAKQCPLDAGGQGKVTDPAVVAAASKDPRCAPGENEFYAMDLLPVGDAELVRRLTGSTDPRIDETLARGGAVVFDPRLVHDGKATFTVSEGSSAQPDLDGRTADSPGGKLPAPREVEVPAILVETDGFAYVPVVISEGAAKLTGVPVPITRLVYDTEKMPSEADQQKVKAAVLSVGGGLVDVERGYQGRPSTQMLMLAAVAVVVALGASGVATGLALADGRRDLATLGAVGAPPSVRRTLSSAQSWVIAFIGTTLGLIVGLLPAAALRWKTAETAERARNSAISDGGLLNAPKLPDIGVVVPWAEMGLALVVVPLLAATIAALFTRSREVTRAGSG